MRSGPHRRGALLRLHSMPPGLSRGCGLAAYRALPGRGKPLYRLWKMHVGLPATLHHDSGSTKRKPTRGSLTPIPPFEKVER